MLAIDNRRIVVFEFANASNKLIAPVAVMSIVANVNSFSAVHVVVIYDTKLLQKKATKQIFNTS